MKIRQIITDYIRRSILTAVGDLVVRGASIPERLAAVAVGQVLKSAGVGALPAWGVPSLKYVPHKIDMLTYNSAGVKEVSGLGFEPVLLFFLAVDTVVENANLSVGFDDGTIAKCIGLYYDATNSNSYGDDSFHVAIDAGNFIKGEVTAIDSDGFDITVALTGAVSVDIIYLAIG